MSNEKLILTEELLEGLCNMLSSPSSDDVGIAATILDNRDITNVESEANFNKLGGMIVKNEKLFPKENRYAIKINGQIMTIKGKIGFSSEADALTNLSKHLTGFIGTEKTSLDRYEQHKMLTKYIKSVDLEDYEIFNNYKTSYSIREPLRKKYLNDPTYKEFLKKAIKKSNEEFFKKNLADLKRRDPYLYTIKYVFKSGIKLRDFLVKNKLIQIVQI